MDGLGHRWRFERRPHLLAIDTQLFCEVNDRHDDAPAESNAGDVAGADECVRRGAGDAEDLGGLLDGHGQGLVRSHAHVGPQTSPVSADVGRSFGTSSDARGMSRGMSGGFPGGEPANV